MATTRSSAHAVRDRARWPLADGMCRRAGGRHGNSYGAPRCADLPPDQPGERRRIQKLTDVLPAGAPFGGRSASGMRRATVSVWKRFM